MAANRFELLATWYLRFNGFFTIQDFTIHPNSRKQGGGTDADILAVRFPYSAEYQIRFQFERDNALIRPDRIDFLIGEVKTGRCDINQNTWRDADRENVEYAMRWMGFESDNNRIKTLASRLYTNGLCDIPEENKCIRFICFGAEENHDLKKELPHVQQILHAQVIEYLRERFCLGCFNITRENWERDIIEFAQKCEKLSNEDLLKWAKISRGQHQSD